MARDPYTYISKPLSVQPGSDSIGIGQQKDSVKPRVSTENTPTVRFAAPERIGGDDRPLSIRVKHGADPMTRHLDEAVAQRNETLAAQRAKSASSRLEEKKNPAVRSSRDGARSRAITRRAYIDTYRPPESSRIESAIVRYRPSEPLRAESSVGVQSHQRFSASNAKRVRSEMEDQSRDPKSSPSEPSKRRKVIPKAQILTETESLRQMKTMGAVEAVLASLNKDMKACEEHARLVSTSGAKYIRENLEQIEVEKDRLLEAKKRARHRRSELDEENKTAKAMSLISRSSLSRIPNTTQLNEGKRSNGHQTEMTRRSDHVKGPSNTGIAKLSDCVGQILTVTQKIADLDTAYPAEGISHGAVTGFAHALISNAEKLMQTTTNVARKILNSDVTISKRSSKDNMGYGTAAAVDSLIASERAASGRSGYYLKAEPVAKSRRPTAAEVIDEAHPSYQRDWEETDLEMSLP